MQAGTGSSIGASTNASERDYSLYALYRAVLPLASICRYQDILVKFPGGCPILGVFQNLSFSCSMSSRLELLDVFNREFTMSTHSLSVHGSTPSLECHISL